MIQPSNFVPDGPHHGLEIDQAIRGAHLVEPFTGGGRHDLRIRAVPVIVAGGDLPGVLEVKPTGAVCMSSI